MKLFKKLLDYGEYLKEYPLHQNLKIYFEDFLNLDKKNVEETYYIVDPNTTIPYTGKFDGLIFLSLIMA